MEQIDAVNLVANHVHRWRLRDRSGTLPAGWIILRIEGVMHCISGSAWSDFVGPRVHARLTFCAQQDGRYRIYGDEWRGFVGQNRGAMLTLYAREGDNATHRLGVRQ
ncbi:hypothetical protein ERO13_D04G175124v2 [Gossypium hirsutum]|nr:hypothetical protein ERO13_D04G175124v2 [Gossypium hirsutum]